MDEPDGPELYATIDTDDNGTAVLRVAVTHGEAVYETTTSDLGTLIRSQQYVSAFERSTLMLLDVWDQMTTVEPEDAAGEVDTANSGGETRSEAPPAAKPTPEDD